MRSKWITFFLPIYMVTLVISNYALGFSQDNALGLGDGTLPLKLVGVAADARLSSSTLEMHVSLQSVLSQAPTVRCSSSVYRQVGYRANGDIQIGTQRFTIQGVCYSNQSRQVEIIAQGNTGYVTVSGRFRQGSVTNVRLSGSVETKVYGETKSYKLEVSRIR